MKTLTLSHLATWLAVVNFLLPNTLLAQAPSTRAPAEQTPPPAVPVRPVPPQQRQEPPIPGEEQKLRRLELKDTTVQQATRLIAEMSGLNVVSTPEAGQIAVNLYLQDVSARQAVEILAKVAGLWFRADPRTRSLRLMTTEEYQNDLVVFREDLIRVFTLHHPNGVSVARALQDLYGPRVFLTLSPLNDDQLLLSSGGGGFGGGFGGGGFGGGGFGGGLNGGFGGINSGLGGFGGGINGGFGGNNFGGGFGNIGNSFGGGFGGGGAFSRPGGGGGFVGNFGNGGFNGGFGNQNGFGGNQFSGGAFGFQTGNNQQPLTSEQAALLAQQTGDGRVTAEDIRRVTGGEPPIWATINQQHNLVIIRTSDSQVVQEIEYLVQEIDRPTPQVLLEMKILEVTLDDNFRSAFDLQSVGGPQGPLAATQMLRNPFIQNAATAAENVLGVGNFPVEGGTLVFQVLNDTIRARIELLATENRINILATPLILASNNRAATISVAEQAVLTTGVNTQVVQAANAAATTVISPVTEVRNVGTNLLVLPRINADRTVTLYINQESSTIKPDGSTLLVAAGDGTITEQSIDTVDSRSLQTPVVAKDGLTIAVGGLIRTSISNSQQKVPFVGDLPYVGRLFRREVRQRLKTELVLLITPHILGTPVEAEIVSQRRAQVLSDHPYQRCGDAALKDYFQAGDTWYLRDDIQCPPALPQHIEPPYTGRYRFQAEPPRPTGAYNSGDSQLPPAETPAPPQWQEEPLPPPTTPPAAPPMSRMSSPRTHIR